MSISVLVWCDSYNGTPENHVIDSRHFSGTYADIDQVVSKFEQMYKNGGRGQYHIEIIVR